MNILTVSGAGLRSALGSEGYVTKKFVYGFPSNAVLIGEVAEWLKAHDSKSCLR